MKDVNVWPLLEEPGEHRACRHHHLSKEVIHMMASWEALQEVVASDREVHGISLCGIDGINERPRLDEGPKSGRCSWDGMARGVNAVWYYRSLKLIEAKPGPAVAKREEARHALSTIVRSLCFVELLGRA